MAGDSCFSADLLNLFGSFEQLISMIPIGENFACSRLAEERLFRIPETCHLVLVDIPDCASGSPPG